MTIASTTSRISYTGDAVTLAFAVPFYFQNNSDLVVTLTDTLGAQTVQVLSTNYSLTGATLSAGGTCTFVVAPPTGYLITIYRDPPMTQTQSYNNNDPFPAKSHELALDKALTIDQRTRDLIGRSIHITDAEAANTVTSLAPVATRKNKLLGFDTAGALTYVVGPTFVNATGTGVAVVDSRATAQVTTFAGSVNVVMTRGATVPGDGGGLDYVRGIVSSPTPFQDASGGYWTPATVLGLAANSVSTATILDFAITYAKLQSMTALRLFGNPTGGLLRPQEVSLGNGLVFAGGTSVTVDPAMTLGMLTGLTLSVAGSTGVFSVAAGAASDTRSSTGEMMVLASAFTKNTNAWAVGSGNGSLDTGAIAAGGWYHVWLIKQPSSGSIDILISLSATSPTIPSGYTLARRIGSMKTDGASQWIKFTQVHDEFLWDSPVLDINTTIGAAAVTQTLASVPTGIIVNAMLDIGVQNAAVGVFVYLSSLAVADIAASPTANSSRTQITNTAIYSPRFLVRTNVSAQFRARSDTATTNLIAATIGWIDTRGK